MSNNKDLETIKKEIESYKKRIATLEFEKKELGDQIIELNSDNSEIIESAKKSVRSQLSYRLGSVIVSKTRSKKLLSYLTLPYELIREYKKFKLDKKGASQEKPTKKQATVRKKEAGGSFNYARYIKEYLTARESAENLYKKCKQFDVISFDIFDTALIRKVEFPSDIFDIVGLKIGSNEFSSNRRKCEAKAREIKYAKANTREVTLDEIYDLMEYFGYNKDHKNIEIKTEIASSIRNPIIYDIYSRLIKDKKTIVFTSDMYLPLSVIEEMLKKNGYDKFEKVFLSNVYQKRKSDGTLQTELKKYFKDKKIIHLGDSLSSDKIQTENAGIAAEWVPDVRIKTREPYLNNLNGSIYRAVLNNTLNNGLWSKDKYYTIGYRVGGILTTGYCKFINEIAEKEQIGKILFCARDCDVISKSYTSFFKLKSSHYVDISRYAILNLCPEKYASDILNRFIFRYWEENKNSKTIREVLTDTGYGYLVQHLDAFDIEEFQFCSSVDKKRFEEFFLKNINIISKHNKPSIDAAISYYKGIVGNWKKLLIVDVGWSGTCITALEYFLKKYVNPDLRVIGTLICTSNKKEICNEINSRHIYSYICSPANNSDLERFMMPDKKTTEENDLIHMPLEYMFTSTKASLVAYYLKEGKVFFERDRNTPPNRYQIEQIQEGILDFCKVFSKYEKDLEVNLEISPYTAFIPLKQLIENKAFVKDIYKDFIYDACTAPYAKGENFRRFISLFPDNNTPKSLNQIDRSKETILFISPEMIYAGAPRSLLRTAKLAKELNFNVIVWSAKQGPFTKEFIENHIPVEIVDINLARTDKYKQTIKECKLVYCNTIVTDAYVRLIKELKIPLIWFIREATNIPDFCRSNPERLRTLREVDDIYCVSEYAANAIRQYTDRQIKIIHNCVEDEKDLINIVQKSDDDKVKFVQFGTIEYRKGYDVLLSAYKKLPPDLKSQCELYFAGGFVNSGTPFCSYLFTELQDEKNVHYLGLIQGEKKKIQTLSEMDVIVVASRDESCSLVALEGAMLSKPLIVTENVGAKYIVKPDNGLIVKTGDVESLKNALAYFISNKNKIARMGKKSRECYESLASIEKHKKELDFAFNNAGYTKPVTLNVEKNKKTEEPQLIVSLTSYPARIEFVKETINSLLNQNYSNYKIILWLSKSQFENEDTTLPKDLLELTKHSKFKIEWVNENLRPHKKYFYAAQKYNEYPLVIVDDDAIYSPEMLRVLANSYIRHPDCVSANRVNLIQFNRNREFRSYSGWTMGYKSLIDTPSYQLLPTGVGGVLYPPHSISKEALNADAIKNTCIDADDLWLKIHSVISGFKTVLASSYVLPTTIEGSQETALWRNNVSRTGNDDALNLIFSYLEENNYNIKEISEKIRRDRFM